MRLWNLPLPHPIFFISTPLLCAALPLQLFSSVHFQTPFVGGMIAFTYKAGGIVYFTETE